jgi:hypothetical protein
MVVLGAEALRVRLRAGGEDLPDRIVLVPNSGSDAREEPHFNASTSRRRSDSSPGGPPASAQCTLISPR